MYVIGLMSGSSLDGLDLACCHLTQQHQQWHYRIVAAECIAYSTEWTKRLRQLPQQNAQTLWQTHIDYGHLLGKLTAQFISRHQLQGQVQLIGSHGHTVFHEPAHQMTCQIGDGAAIAHHLQLPVVADFRSADLAAGGQGAPMVPIADLHLFEAYRFCLNLGGIANLSAKTAPQHPYPIVGFDVCYANQILDRLAQQIGLPYDHNGDIANNGQLLPELLQQLNNLAFGKQGYPKSLNNQQSDSLIMPLLAAANSTAPHLLHTFGVYIAQQVAHALQLFYDTEQLSPQATTDRMLVTGGGALNSFVVAQLRRHCATVQVVVPDLATVQFKEALLMAFAANLRWQGQANFVSSVTGAAYSAIGGALYGV